MDHFDIRKPAYSLIAIGIQLGSVIALPIDLTLTLISKWWHEKKVYISAKIHFGGF